MKVTDRGPHGRRTVLVTGHLGYVGTVAMPVLAAARYRVTGCDTNLFDRADFFPGGEIMDVPNIARDIRDLTPDDLAGVDAVVHLAALSNDPLGQLRPGLTQEINHEGTLHVARCARAAGGGALRLRLVLLELRAGRRGDDRRDRRS